MTKSKIYWLDSNVLIALAPPEHSRTRAAAWFVKGYRFATCHITQGELLLESISSLPRHEFWPDDLSYLDMST
jgi:predicted nucleic acid-binding protein